MQLAMQYVMTLSLSCDIILIYEPVYQGFIYYMNNTEIIILAAGKGTRMNADVPKVLVPLKGTPMISYVLEAVLSSGVEKPIMVVGYEAQQVMEYCGPAYHYALQEEQKGTGHAVLQAKDLLLNTTQRVVVVYGDQPFVKPETLQNLAQSLDDNAKLVIATSVIHDDELFEKQFSRFGRIVRDSEGNITAIVEAKDATEAELEIREVNVGFMAFERAWAFHHLSELKNDNAQGEYYLTDLVKIAFEENLPIQSVQMSEQEALGANTQEQLRVIEEYM